MPNGFDNDVLFADNVDFTGTSPVQPRVTLNGQLLIGSTVAPNIRVGTLSSSDGSVTITPGAGTIDLKSAGMVATTYTTDSGSATPVGNVLIVTGGTGITTAGSGNTLTITNTNAFAPNATLNLFDDFLATRATSVSLLGSSLCWFSNNSGTDSWAPATFGETGHPGLLTCSSATGTGLKSLFLGFPNPGNVMCSFIFGGGIIVETWIFKINNLSNGTNRYILRAGFGDFFTSGTDQNNGAYFEYSDNLNSGQWNYKTANGGVRTTNNSAIAVTTGWHKAQITVNAAASSISFTMDGVSLGAAITTNIPTSNSCTPFFAIDVTLGSIANNTGLIDLFYLTQTLTTPR